MASQTAISRRRIVSRSAVGLVSPLPPQVGGVASVAEWLLAHQEELGVRYEPFDVWRPAGDEVGGRVRADSLVRQAVLLARFVVWLGSAPRVVHLMVSCTASGLTRDAVFAVLLRLTGRATIAHVHGPELDAIDGSGWGAAALRLVGRVTVERVSVARWAVVRLTELGVEARCISNPVRIWPERRPTAAAGVADAPLRLLFVGNYGARKGAPELVAALAEVRAAGVDARLRFVGKEERRGQHTALLEQVQALRLEGIVGFSGVLHGEELADAFRTADAICLPSRRELLPMALLEGMAYGLPVLASRVGGITELVEHREMGLLVEPGDVEAISTAIRELASDAESRRAMGEAARARVEVVASSETITAAWQALYRSVSAERPSRP